MKIMHIVCIVTLALVVNVALGALQADEQAIKELKSLDMKYKDYALADASNVPQIGAVSVSTVGGLEYVTKYAAGRVGAVKISKDDQDKLKKALSDSVQRALQQKQEPNSNWRLLVVCDKATGAMMGGGAIWKNIPCCETEDLEEGINLGSGGSVQTVVKGRLYVLDTGRKLLLHHKSLYASGRDANTALQAFANTVAADFTAWARKQASEQPQEHSAASQPATEKQPARKDGSSEDVDVVFGPGLRGSMTVSYKGRVILASQVGQTTAVRVIEKDGKMEEVRVPVSLWTSVPFHAGKTINVGGFGGLALGTLDMGYKDFYFPKERTIGIEETDDGFTLMPSKDSLVPIWIDATGAEVRQELLVRAANVTWVFKKEGTRFETITHTYVTTKPAAKVSFTKDGVRLDGVTATEKKQDKDKK